MKGSQARFLLLLLPGLAILPWANQFPFPVHSQFSDLAISHYPNAVFLLDSIQRYHQIPLWSPLILSGYPFAANPLSGLWYPPGWLALLFPLPLGFNLVIALHWLVGGTGMYCWLRAEGLARDPSLFGAVTFQLLPRVFAHFAAGHLTFSYAIAWTPWLLYMVRTRSFAGKGIRFFAEGILLGVIALADLRWLAFSGILWAAYRLYQYLKAREPLMRWLATGFTQVLIAFLLAAPMILPLLEYTRLSTRSGLNSAENLVLSLPPVRLMSLFSPSLDGNTEWTVYAGGVVLVLSLWAAGNRNLRQRLSFWLAIATVSLLLSLGSNFPLVPLLFQLPGFSLLRVPSRFVILAGFALAVTAAWTVDYLAEGTHAGEKAAFWSRLAAAGATAFTILAAVGTWSLSGRPPVNFLWGSGAITLAAILLFLYDRGGMSAGRWIWLILLVCIVDLSGVNRMSVQYHPGAEVLLAGQDTADYLANQLNGSRIFSSSYSLQQQVAARHSIEMANGIDPLQLFGYTKFIEKASGVPAAGYSVVLPPVTGDNLSHGNAGSIPDARLLGWLNTAFILSEDDLQIDGLIKVHQFGETRIYQNQYVLPGAWVQLASRNAKPGTEIQFVDALIVTPNWIEVTASGPGRLVLSELMYPGWKAEVDGEPVQIEPIAGLLRSVPLASGMHNVRFSFTPWRVFAGLGASGLVAVFILGWGLLCAQRGLHEK